MSKARFSALAMVLVGIPMGIGLFTLHYSGATSYLSDDPAACANCHIMNSQYDSWQKASHHGVATCVDCHLPADFIGKYTAKALNGYHHSKAFTFQDFHEPIMITERNAEILQENCVRCHGDLFHTSTDAHGGEALRCVHCHRASGHGPWLGLGGAETSSGYERDGP